MMTDSPNGPLTPLSLTHLCQLEQQIKEMKTWHWLQVTQSCIETKHVGFFFNSTMSSYYFLLPRNLFSQLPLKSMSLRCAEVDSL